VFKVFQTIEARDKRKVQVLVVQLYKIVEERSTIIESEEEDKGASFILQF
jgi:hypothetical protein